MVISVSTIFIFIYSFLHSFISKNKHFFKKTSKIVCVILVAMVGIIFSFRLIEEADNIAYHEVYLSLANNTPSSISYTAGIDYGFRVLMHIFSKIGISYSFFRLILFWFSLLLISFSVRKITPYYLPVVCLYLIFPFSYDIDQIRQFFCTSIIVFGLSRLLLYPNKWKGIIQYLIVLVVAFFFHQSALFYIVFVFSRIKNRKFYIVVFLFSIIAFLLSFMFGVDMVAKIAATLGISKVVYYVGMLSNYHMNPLLSLFELLLMVVFVWVAWTCHKVTRGDSKMEFIWKISCLSSLILPALTFSLMFERLLRPMIILVYCAFSHCFILKKYYGKYLVFFVLLITLGLRLSFSFEYIIKMFSNFTFTGK